MIKNTESSLTENRTKKSGLCEPHPQMNGHRNGTSIGVDHKQVTSNLEKAVCDSNEEKQKSLNPNECSGPDCSWSWVIAVACGLLNFFSLGVMRSASVLYLNTIEFYGVSRSAASWPVFLISSVSNLSGLATGYLTRRFGARSIALSGTTISFLAVSSCFFADTVSKLTIFCGALYGFGMGLNVPAIAVCLNLWFDEKKVIASGIIYTGAALGSLFFPSFLDFIIGVYGFRGGIAIMGALIGNAIACALLIRMPPWVNIDGSPRDVPVCDEQRRATIDRFGPDHPLFESGNYFKRSISQHSLSSEASDDVHFHNQAHRFHEAVHHHTVEPVQEMDEDVEIAVVDLNSKTEVDHSIVDRVLPRESTTDRKHSCYDGSDRGSEYHTSSHDTEKAFVTRTLSNGVLKMAHSHKGSRGESMRSTISGVFTAISSEHEVCRSSMGSGNKLRLRTSSLAMSTGLSLCAPAVSIDCGLDSIVRNTPTTPQNSSPNKLIYLVGFSFLILLNCNTCFQTVLLDHAQDQGIDRHSAVHLVWAFALCDIAGRLSIGFISGTGMVSNPVIMATAFGLIAICHTLASIVTCLQAMLLWCMVLGFCTGTIVILISVLMGDYSNDLSKISMYIGWMGFATGITGLGRSFVIGFFRDTIGDYGGLLRVMSFCGFGCSLAWAGVSLNERLSDWHERRRIKKIIN